MKVKNLAILTSGGDAPGMNSALFGAFYACQEKKINLYAVMGGFDGLIDNNFKLTTFDMFDGRLNRGGSIIKCSRSQRFLRTANLNKAVDNLRINEIDGLIIIGGDGTTKGAIKLKKAGVKIISIPATIDNDMNFSYTLGFDTATNNIVNATDAIIDSLSSFNYGAVIKIMGNTCDRLIKDTALAIHTKFVIKTKKVDTDKLAKQIKEHCDGNHVQPVVLVLEDNVDTVELAKTLQEKTRIQFRPHILGYIQRGGTPSAFDRKYGYSAGIIAVDALTKSESGLCVGIDGDNFVKKTFETALKID
ncbi:MAG: 6-phosphofructokinase [Clostridia bacterium]|nr:6-phosphofructokinase [Clostridia bacterium]